MSPIKSFLLAAALGTALLPAAQASSLLNDPLRPVGTLTGQLLADQYIVELSPEALSLLGVSSVAGVAQTLLAGVGGGEVLHVYEHALSGFAVRMTALQADLLSRMPGVLRVEQDQLMRAVATQNNATWGLDRVDQRVLPLDGRYTYPDSAGVGVNVYIIDTGLRGSHVEFTGRVGVGRNFAPNSGSLLGGSTDPANTTDCNGHGTHVAGTASGTVYGVAKRSTTYPVRVLGCDGSGSNSGVIAGVDWVAANHLKPAVANMSISGGNSTVLDNAVRAAISRGVTFVVAAGNSNANACTGSPNRVAEALTIGSTTNTDARSSFSNFGSCVDLFAPGSNITSAWFQNDTQIRTISGTSMAAPHVAGAAALVLTKQPTLTPDEVAAVLLADATAGVLSGIGTGSPNLLLYVDPSDNGEPIDRPPTAAFTVSCTLLSCDFDASGSSDDVGIASYAWTFGDGASGSGVITSHNYLAKGSYTVTLTVTDTAGQSSSLSQAVSVDDGLSPCADCPTRYTGSLSGAGAEALHPGSNGYSFGGGSIRGFLRGPANANFDLFLERQSCGLLFCSWSVVASGQSGNADEDVIASVGSGTYRWRLRSQSGAGEYELLTDPR
jgi:subtilisin family serine protease